MINNKVYTSDIGTEIELDTLVDITTGTVFAIDYLSPGSSVIDTWVAGLTETTKLTYIKPDAWTITGIWKLQASVTFADGSIFKGETVSIRIYDRMV